MNFSNMSCGRFYFAMDMNSDGVVTISDLWLFLKFAWLLPSKLIVEIVAGNSRIASFFEIDCFTGESGGGAVFSFFAWFVAFNLVVIGLEDQKKH